jgi:membrane-associated protease RseP (regulator of RpoE activity)
MKSFRTLNRFTVVGYPEAQVRNAGIRAGDAIVSVNGTQITSRNRLKAALAGDEVHVSVVISRAGQSYSAVITRPRVAGKLRSGLLKCLSPNKTSIKNSLAGTQPAPGTDIQKALFGLKLFTATLESRGVAGGALSF